MYGTCMVTVGVPVRWQGTCKVTWQRTDAFQRGSNSAINKIRCVLLRPSEASAVGYAAVMSGFAISGQREKGRLAAAFFFGGIIQASSRPCASPTCAQQEGLLRERTLCGQAITSHIYRTLDFSFPQVIKHACSFGCGLWQAQGGCRC